MLGKSLILHDTSPLRPSPPLRRPRGEIVRVRAAHQRRRGGRKEVLEMFMEELDREHKDYEKIVALHLSIDSE